MWLPNMDTHKKQYISKKLQKFRDSHLLDAFKMSQSGKKLHHALKKILDF